MIQVNLWVWGGNGTEVAILRKLTLMIITVMVAGTVGVGDGLARENDQLSITCNVGRAYQDLGDLKQIISTWNAWMDAASEDPRVGYAHAEDIGIGYSLMGDIRYRLGRRFLLSLRLEYLTDNSSTLAVVFGNEFSAAGAPITLTALYQFPGILPGPFRRATVNLGVGGGPVMRGIYKFEFYVPLDNHLTARATSRGFQLHGLAEIDYPVLDRLSLVGEVFYRYTSMGDLTYRSVSGETETLQGFWEGGAQEDFPGIFEGIPFPEEGEKVIYTPAGDVMKLDFGGINFFFGLRFYAF